MDYTLVAALAVGISLVSSFLCSLAEAALYAVPLSYVKYEAEKGSAAGQKLLGFKNEIGRPISAILIFNTLAHTGGAAVSGWAVGMAFGNDTVALFSVLYTLTVLYFTEILPKVLGVIYCRPVARLMVRPLEFLIFIGTPLSVISDYVSKRLLRAAPAHSVSPQEFLSMAAIGREEGALDHFEGAVIENVVGLDQMLVKDVLTPRVVVFRLEENTRISDLAQEIANCAYSRIPIFSEKDPDYLSGYVTQRDIFRELVGGDSSKKVRDISRPLKTVPELVRVDKLLLELFEEREHICAVVDEHGSLAGIVTLEDLLEEVVGKEIVDEYDAVSDLRAFAKLLWSARRRRSSR
ncbi:MAG: DUF21 domain-containing protein [Deltaproteobacteria bacterium]|mgnify:CR=1 FL=1|nr:DUF21 domain-containing protein [Deltaproteobacteria bacterium]